MKGKTSIITGAGSGIGAAIAKLFAEQGMNVVVSDIDLKSANKITKQITNKGGKAIALEADISKPAECEYLVKETLKKYKRLDVAVNNAGIGGAQKPVGEYPIDEWQKVIEINLSGVFYGMHYQIPAMLKNKGGAIINMASILGQVGAVNSSGYVAAKHGVVGLTQNAALEYAKKKIRVNAVGPGYIKTPLLTDNLEKEQLDAIKELHPIGRLGKPQEVAELVLWLASEKASFVTGAYYNIDGGYLAR